MKEEEMTLRDVKSAVEAFARERDWEQFHAPKNLSMAIAAEAAELMEHYLWCTSEESTKLTREAAKREKVAEELADVILFVAQFANVTGIDLGLAIEAKLEQNALKYPVSKAKGRSAKYDELG